MSIFPLPQFEADLAEYQRDKEAYEKLSVPKSLVVRFGAMKLVGEFPYDGTIKPGCGSKMVVRTHRGTELGEMLTSTCPNSGCSKSVSRKEMLEYIENSGGAEYPFFTDGRVLRVATIEDMNAQRTADARKDELRRRAQQLVVEHMLAMKIVEAEPILGAERLTFYFTAEDRVDFRDLVGVLSREFTARIELRQVGARDEARLIADYEKCGQHCCCKQFLKVLKPVSMKSAKIQKATLDPLKISGRCGRLMCCLRYEDETYDTLRKRLPRMKSRVGTPHGVGIVVDTQILTQLVLVYLESENKQVAVPVEEITAPDAAPVQPPASPARQQPGSSPPRPARDSQSDPLRGMSAEQIARKVGEPAAPPGQSPQQQGKGQGADRSRQQERYRDASKREDRREPRRDDRRNPPNQGQGQSQGQRPPRDQPRSDGAPPRRPAEPRAPGDAPPQSAGEPHGIDPGDQANAPDGQDQHQGRPKRRRRRGRRGSGGRGGPGGAGNPGGSPGGGSPGPDGPSEPPGA